MTRILTLTFAVVLTCAWGGAAAHAQPTSLQQEVNQVLAEYPGGVQTGPAEVTWNDGDVILTLRSEQSSTYGTDASTSVGSCATGYFCGFSSMNLTGSKISFSSCTAPNLVAPLGSPVRSIANARSSGNVLAFNGGSPVLSVSANSFVNTNLTITRLGC